MEDLGRESEAVRKEVDDLRLKLQIAREELVTERKRLEEIRHQVKSTEGSTYIQCIANPGKVGQEKRYQSFANHG